MTTKWLNNAQIDEMAQAALTSYEWSCSWHRAEQAAWEYCEDTWQFKPRQSAVKLAVKLAKMLWDERVLQTKIEIGYYDR